MTDHTHAEPDHMTDDREMDDIELITSLLNGQLEPARAEAVKRRLKEDPEFYELAWPLIVAWSVPKRLARQPRPEGELEREWEKFKQRTGFPRLPGETEPPAAPPVTPTATPPASPNKKRRRWPYWVVGLLVLVYGGGLFLTPRRTVGLTIPDVPYSPVPYDTGWIALNEGIEVRLEPGASLQRAHVRVFGRKHLTLDGAARFRVWPTDTTAPMLRPRVLTVQTRAGLVIAGESEFTVETRGDTTLVHYVPHPAHRRALDPSPRMVSTYNEIDKVGYEVILREGEGARLIVGQDPDRIIPLPTR